MLTQSNPSLRRRWALYRETSRRARFRREGIRLLKNRSKIRVPKTIRTRIVGVIHWHRNHPGQ